MDVSGNGPPSLFSASIIADLESDDEDTLQKDKFLLGK